MNSPREMPPVLAPLQLRMLRDSRADPGAGHHVEQVDIVFAGGVSTDRIPAAWRATVDATEALRIAFPPVEAGICGWGGLVEMEIVRGRPVSWDRWLDKDRRRPLLAEGAVPWRAVFWPGARRLIWTFHHALLDGRSIARVLRSFLERLDGGEPDPLPLSRWTPPTAAVIGRAEEIFREMADGPAAPAFPPVHGKAPAIRRLGHPFAGELAHRCAQLEVTVATVLVWCWGQAVARVQDVPMVWVEQLRAGAPQPGTAGFAMNTLPVRIRRDDSRDPGPALRDFRDRLLDLREIESVSPADFPPGVYPDLDGPETSVVMVEHAALDHLVGFSRWVDSLELIEPEGPAIGLAASAHIAPDLRLRVDGPEKHALLDAWCDRVRAVAGAPA